MHTLFKPCVLSLPQGLLLGLVPSALQLRPVSDLKNTLLHEMIHAELFLEGIRDRGDHGPKFQTRMNAINSASLADPQVRGWQLLTCTSCTAFLVHHMRLCQHLPHIIMQALHQLRPQSQFALHAHIACQAA